MNNGNSDNNQANSNNNINSTLAQFGINTNNLQTPQVESLSYDNQTGTADLTLNFTNPMKTQTLDVSSFSVDVADSNGTHLVTVQLDQGIDIGAGQTGNLSLMANALNDQGKALMESLISGNGGTIDTSDLQFTNLNANVGGIIIHVDNLNGFSQGSNGNGS
jgi:hypothetical protein